jgi:hypothetical protein
VAAGLDDPIAAIEARELTVFVDVGEPRDITVDRTRAAGGSEVKYLRTSDDPTKPDPSSACPPARGDANSVPPTTCNARSTFGRRNRWRVLRPAVSQITD